VATVISRRDTYKVLRVGTVKDKVYSKEGAGTGKSAL
jgi:hypothetical protein